jgi:hypothetical protein
MQKIECKIKAAVDQKQGITSHWFLLLHNFQTNIE